MIMVHSLCLGSIAELVWWWSKNWYLAWNFDVEVPSFPAMMSMNQTGEEPLGPTPDEMPKTPMIAHIAPFAVWLAVMFGLGEPAAWKYALRAALGLAALLWFRPWRWYAPLAVRHVPLALIVGVLVFVVWVLPESKWIGGQMASLQDLYLHWFVAPFGSIAAESHVSAYAPDRCGWPLTLVRIGGSAMVIPIIEEFFWRGFLYRWLLGTNFVRVDMGKFRWSVLLVVSLAFGFEHHRWLVGFVAGLAYGLFVLRTKDIWAACVAHAVTNLLLGIYVINTESFGFW